MTKRKKLRLNIPKWLAIVFLVLGVFFLLGATTGQLDMLIIGTVFTVLAIAGFVDNKKPAIAQQTDKTIATTAAQTATQHQAVTQPNKKVWYKTWWGILLVVLVFIPIGLTVFIITFAMEGADRTHRQENTPERVVEREKQETDDQVKREQETAAQYQKTIDTYAPIYCKNHQDITINEPALEKDGWPLADGQAGITDDECKELIGLLYLQRATDAKIESSIESLSERKVAIGMTKVEAVYAWGSPSDINKTTSGAGTSEQWVFGNPIYGANYVYFDNDIVTSIQN